MSEQIEITTVGSLRKAIEGLPDDRILIKQVVGYRQDSGAWNMYAYLTREVGDLTVLTFKHPQLVKINPDVEWVKK